MGTRAITHIVPKNVWVITQWDGDRIGHTLSKIVRTPQGRKNVLKLLHKQHEIRAKGKTKREVTRDYGLTTKRDIYLYLEYYWIVTKNWKVQLNKSYQRKAKMGWK